MSRRVECTTDAAAEPPGDIERATRLRAMGTVLSDGTGDESDDGWGGWPVPTGDTGTEDAALRREVPPHHVG